MTEIYFKRKLLFVINPKAGTRAKSDIPQKISQIIDKSIFDYSVVYTERAGHATELAEKASQSDCYAVIATGGDGTVNEVMQGLVNSNTALGILPFGSGNGLARFLQVPMQLEKALQFINESVTTSIDVCALNNHLFVNVAGTGFDAHIGHVFAQQKGRGLKTYITSAVKEFNDYQSESYRIEVDNQTIEKEAFMVSFANSSQFGNNAHIAPQADIQDGLVDICIMKPMKWLQVPHLVSSLFMKSLHQTKLVEIIKTNKATIYRKKPGPIHIDGEPLFEEEKLEVKVYNKALKVLIAE